MAERRRAYRWRTYLAGQVEFHRRCARLECLVRNLSPIGAKLIFRRPGPIPDAFTLSIPQRGEEWHVKIVWCAAQEAGVTFHAVATTEVVSIDAARHIKMLEAEREALARRIARLRSPP